jgi:hypothetical protein
MSVVAVGNLLAAAREVADQRGVPTRVLAVEMMLAAPQAITGKEATIGREALVKGIRTVFSDIADADLHEAPKRATAAFLAQTLFAQARAMKLDMMEVAKEVVAVSYAELVDNGDKALSRQIANIMFPAFCAKAQQLYAFGALTTTPNSLNS